MDRTVDPCDNFYEFACGKFRRNTPITNAGTTWTDKFNKWIEIRLKIILESNSTTNSSRFDALARKARRLYATCLKEESDGSQIREILQLLGPLPVINSSGWAATSLESFVARAHRLGMNSLFEMSLTIDDKINFYRYEMLEPKLFAPSLDFYSSNSSNARTFRPAFLRLLTSVIGRVRKESGASDAPVDAEDILKMETRLASLTKSLEERRDPIKAYNKWSLGQLKKKVPSFNWDKYFAETLVGTNVTLSDDDPLIVSAPNYFNALENIIRNNPSLKTQLANLALLTMMQRARQRLGPTFRKAFSDYRQKVFGPTKEEIPWKYCASQVNSLLTDIVTRLYVDRFFGRHSLDEVREITKKVRKIFASSLSTNSWMDKETKRAALIKLERLKEKIAYPPYIFDDDWMVHEFRNIPTGTNFVRDTNIRRQNMRASELMQLRQNLNKERWGSNEVIVAPGAAYHPYFNQLYIKIGILQAPMFDKNYPKYLNYGGIGMVIGHEITHGFDDENRLRDENGNLNQWWSKSAIDSFQNDAKCFVDQYSAFKVVTPNRVVNVNGKLTLGENIADNGGLNQAYEAYQEWVKTNGEELRLPELPYTPNQLFFINFGQNWCSTATHSEMLLSMLSDLHSPDRFRVLGVLSNIEGFQKAFHCKRGSAMNRKKKCVIWR